MRKEVLKPFKVEVYYPKINAVTRQAEFGCNVVAWYASARTAFKKASTIAKDARVGVSVVIQMRQKERADYVDIKGRKRSKPIYVSCCALEGQVRRQPKGYEKVDRAAA